MSGKWRALVLLCAVQTVFACGKRNPGGSSSAVLAQVGDRSITQGAFEERLAGADRRFLPDTLDLGGKRKFLDFMINEQVMAKKAEELQYGSDPLLQSNLKQYEERQLLDAAIQELCKGKLEVTDKDIQDFADRRLQKILVKHILVKTRQEAEDVRKQIVAGANFDSMAAKYTIVARKDREGADLPLFQRVTFGEVQYGELMMSIEDAVFATKIGEVSAPVWTGYGWHLFLPVSSTAVHRTPIDPDMRHRIDVQIQQRRKRHISEDYAENILQKHGFKLDDAVLAQVYDKLPADVPLNRAPKSETEVKPVIAFTQTERTQTLFELDGKKSTVGDFSDHYDDAHFAERPKQQNGSRGLRDWIRDHWLRSLQVERARKDGIDKLPAVADALRQRREHLMASQLQDNMVGSQAPDPSEEQVQEFYTKHRSAYVQKEQRRCNVVFHPQERVVRRAYDEIRGGANFVETAMRYMSVTEAARVQTPLFTADNPQFAEIATRVFALPKGQYTEPLKTTQGWVVLQVDMIVPEQQLQLDQVHDVVISDFKNQWSNDKLQELLTQWKKGMKIDVHDDVLGRAAVRRTDVVVPGATAAAAAKSGSTSS